MQPPSHSQANTQLPPRRLVRRPTQARNSRSKNPATKRAAVWNRLRHHRRNGPGSGRGRGIPPLSDTII
jgi:hypothetical protein